MRKPNALKITRREFGRRSALAAAAAAPYFVPASVLGTSAPSNRITLGCIGVGNQGMPIMKKFMEKADCQVLAVCDVNRGSFGYRDDNDFYGREPAQQAVNAFYAKRGGVSSYQGCEAYNDFREVLARNDIQAVTIVTPDHWHAPMTVAAAKAGKDIYCEKPLSLTINQGRAMADAVRKYGRILQVGSHERSNPVARQVCELARNGYLGEIKNIVTHVGEHNKVGPGPGWRPMPVPEGFDYEFWLGPAPQAPYHEDRCLYRFRFNYDYSGGQVTNFGAHSLDMAQWGLDMDDSGPVEVEYLDAKYLLEGSLFNAATHTKFRMRYENGVELLCKTADPAVFIEFQGSEGKVAMGYGIKGVRAEPTSLAEVKIDEDKMLYVSNDHVRNFLECVKDRRDPVAPVEVGHSSSTLCHLGNIAIRLQAKLSWDPSIEEFTGSGAEQANDLLTRPRRGDWPIT